jgi:hypothetical protein
MNVHSAFEPACADLGAEEGALMGVLRPKADRRTQHSRRLLHDGCLFQEQHPEELELNPAKNGTRAAKGTSREQPARDILVCAAGSLLGDGRW